MGGKTMNRMYVGRVLSGLLGMSVMWGCGSVDPVSNGDNQNQAAIEVDSPLGDSTVGVDEDSSITPEPEGDGSSGENGDVVADEDAVSEDTWESADVVNEDTTSSLEHTQEEEDTTKPVLVPEPRNCELVFGIELPPGTTSAAVPSSLNAWATDAWVLSDEDGDGVWAVSYTHLTLPTTPYV